MVLNNRSGLGRGSGPSIYGDTMTTVEQQLRSLWDKQVQITYDIEQLEAQIRDVIVRSARLSQVVCSASDSMGNLILDNHKEITMLKARMDQIAVTLDSNDIRTI